MIKLHKKAMLDDLFDLLFTVFAGVFVYFFLSFSITANAEARDKVTLGNLGKTEAEKALVDFLATPVQFEEHTVSLMEVLSSDLAHDTEKKRELFRKTAEGVIGSALVHTVDYPNYKEDWKQHGWEGIEPWSLQVYEGEKVVVFNTQYFQAGGSNCKPDDFTTSLIITGNRRIVLCVLNSFLKRGR